MRGSFGLLALGTLAGCYVRAGYAYRAQPVYTAQPVYAQPAYAQPVPAQPVQTAPPAYVAPVCQCRQGAVEVCNGCDDNCNGVIDEGCARY